MMVTRRRNRPFWSSYILALATVLAGLLLWHGLATPPAAYAQIPDSGAQFNEMIKEIRISNQKLTEIAGYLREMRDAQAADRKERASKPPAEKP